MTETYEVAAVGMSAARQACMCLFTPGVPAVCAGLPFTVGASRRNVRLLLFMQAQPVDLLLYARYMRVKL